MAIFDPGIYSWESGLFDVTKIEKLDDIIITHDHGDHLNMQFVLALVDKFPEATIITTESAAKMLADVGITTQTTGTKDAVFFHAHHESMIPLMPTMTANFGVHYMDQLTHPGDSHHFDETKAILALPIIAPWGSMADAAMLATKLKPRYVIPIHDAPFNDAARANCYAMLTKYFDSVGIEFISPVNGVSFEI